MIECKICGKEFENNRGISYHVIHTHNLTSKDYYLKYIGLSGKCLVCGQNTTFRNIENGYRKYCSSKCSNASDEVKQRKKETCLKKYGVNNISQLEEIKKKKQKTYIKNFGVDSPFKSEEVKDKIKETNLERYGVNHPMKSLELKNKQTKKMQDLYGVEYASQSEEIKEKTKQTCLDKYGVDHPLKSLEIREKIKKTHNYRYGVETPLHLKNIRDLGKKKIQDTYGVQYIFESEEMRKKAISTIKKKYGVDTTLKVKSIRDEIKKTCLDNHGVEYPFQSNKIRDKIKTTWMNNYGVDNPLKSKEIQKKSLNTMMDRYGVQYPSQSKEIKEKIKQACLEKYGVENPSQSEEMKEKKKLLFFQTLLLSNRLKEKCIPNFTVDDYKGVEFKYSWTCTKCENVFEDNLDNGKIPRCPICYPKIFGTSYLEKEIVTFIRSLGIKVIENSFQIISPKELDIYIPSHNLAIEFNGLYWHSEGCGIDKNYHLNKTLACKDKGIQLLHIFEDEWIDKQEIVKSIITAKLGLIQNKIFARKCIIKEVLNEDAKLFLFDNHLQGSINGIHLGLYYEDTLVSILTYGKSRFNKNYDYEILRFCNKITTSVVGGLSKLLKYANLNSVITYCDLRYGTGESYLNCEFEFNSQSLPSYYYLKNNQRLNRLHFQKHLLEDKLELFDPILTEWENMQLNGYDRIWDCGTLTFTRN